MGCLHTENNWPYLPSNDGASRYGDGICNDVCSSIKEDDLASPELLQDRIGIPLILCISLHTIEIKNTYLVYHGLYCASIIGVTVTLSTLGFDTDDLTGRVCFILWTSPAGNLYSFIHYCPGLKATQRTFPPTNNEPGFVGPIREVCTNCPEPEVPE